MTSAPDSGLDYGVLCAQIEARIADARSPFPAADAKAADCRWCGIEKYIDVNGFPRCAHCDDPHDTKKCGICRTILKR